MAVSVVGVELCDRRPARGRSATAPGGRQLVRMFIPVAVAIVVFIMALMLVLKFFVIPAMERGDPNAQARAVGDTRCTADAGSGYTC